MGETVRHRLWNVVRSIVLSLANATLLLVLACLIAGIWGTLTLERAVDRTLLRAEASVVSPLAKQTDRVVDSLDKIGTEIGSLHVEIKNLVLAIEQSPEVRVPEQLVNETIGLLAATKRLDASISNLKPNDFHLSKQTWKNIADTAIEVMAASRQCREAVETTSQGGE